MKRSSFRECEEILTQLSSMQSTCFTDLPFVQSAQSTNPMLTERTVSSSGLSWRSGTSCQSSQASLSRTFQELTWRTGHTAKCFLQQLAWKTAPFCRLDWTQGSHSVPWRLQQNCSKASSMTWEKCLKEALAFCADAYIVRLWDWATRFRYYQAETEIPATTYYLALHQQTLAKSIEINEFNLQKSHAMPLLTMFFFIS